MGINRDREPRTATSTFTQLLSSEELFKYNVALRPQKPYGLCIRHRKNNNNRCVGAVEGEGGEGAERE